MTIHIEEIDKVTHSRIITVENLIELFKERCGAPETAKVLFNYSLGELKRKIEIVWSDDDVPKKTLDIIDIKVPLGNHGHGKTEIVEGWVKDYEVATGEVQVGDLVMVRGECPHKWIGPRVLTTVETEPYRRYRTGDVGWRYARHLTDEERAQIKRI